MTLTAPTTSIPLAPGLPVVGSLRGMFKDPAAFLVRCYRELGPVFRLRLPGQTVTVLAGPELARFMGSREGQAALRSKETWRAFDAENGVERSLISSDGPEHKRLRELMRYGYSREALRGRLDDLVRITDECLDRDWVPGRTVPVVHTVQKLVVSQLGTLLTGHAPLEYVDDIRIAVERALTVHVTRQRPAFVLKLPRYRRARARVNQLRQQMIEMHENASRADGAPRTLVHDIMAAHEQTPDLMSRTDLNMALIGPYVAGLDTVANTISTLIHVALSHPDVLERIRADADAVLAADHLQDDAADAMPSVQGAVQETLRLYPIAVAQPRTAAKDFTYAGHLVRAGEPVYCAVAVPHFLEEFFPDPMRFDIDRYGHERREHARPGAYSPFGRGPHTCLGKGIADVQMTLTVARLFHRRDLALDPPGYAMRRRVAPTPGPVPGFRVKITGDRSPGS